MRVIIAGSRGITGFSTVKAAVEESGFLITEVVSGCAMGVDRVGEMWAMLNAVPVKHFPADWDTHGRAAGPIRNQEMADYAEALIAIPGAKSKGTWDMIRKAEAKGLKVYIHKGKHANDTEGKERTNKVRA
jgi:hypothetical protein